MHLSLHEQERLLVSVAGMVARDQHGRGVKLNHPEAVAILTCFVLEGARDGRRVSLWRRLARTCCTSRNSAPRLIGASNGSPRNSR